MNIEETLTEIDPLLRLIARERVGAQTWLYDDAVQEARIAAWTRLSEGFSIGIAVFKAKQAVIDVCVGSRMTGSKARNVPITRTVGLVQQAPDGGDEYLVEPEDIAAADAFDEVVDSAALDWLLSPLTDEQRSLVHMRLDDLTTREIASELGITHQAVSYRLAKIKAVYGR